MSKHRDRLGNCRGYLGRENQGLNQEKCSRDTEEHLESKIPLDMKLLELMMN